jgi:hypothetical protein
VAKLTSESFTKTITFNTIRRKLIKADFTRRLSLYSRQANQGLLEDIKSSLTDFSSKHFFSSGQIFEFLLILVKANRSF